MSSLGVHEIEYTFTHNQYVRENLRLSNSGTSGKYLQSRNIRDSKGICLSAYIGKNIRRLTLKKKEFGDATG
jgi:hypothetical protein